MVKHSDSEVEWITTQEKDLVIKLRERVKDQLPLSELSKSEDDQDAFLLRWLRARNLDLGKAEHMLLHALEWRVANCMDKVLESHVDPFYANTYRWSFVGSDKDGRPVAICPFYEWDFRKITQSPDSFDTFVRNYFEIVMDRIRQHNEKRMPGQAPVTQYFPVLDVKGFSYGQIINIGAMKKWLQMASVYEAYYPEVLYKLVFLNCPGYFQLFINILKTVISPRTLGKMACYSTVEEWRKDMEEFLDPAILPEQYGGVRRTPTEIDVSPRAE